MNIYKILIYNPLLNILILFYQTIAFNDLGLAIIFLTILIRIILYPLFNKIFKTQTILQKIQPEIKLIQQKNKKDPKKQLEEMMSIYKKYKINPLSMYFFILVQIPILLALYQIFSQDFQSLDPNNIYSFVHYSKNINLIFLGLINLTKPSIIIAGLAALFQFIQIKISFAVLKNQKDVNKIMLYVGPLMTFIFLLFFSSAIGLYWLTTNIFSVINQIFINKKILKEEQNELG